MTDAQKKSMFTWIAQWCRLYKLGVENVKGHKEYDTAGKTCPNLDMDKFRAELKTFMGG